MLKPQPFANSFALSTAGLFLVVYLLKFISPAVFKLILNSQFLGADIASQTPRLGLGQFIGMLIAVAVVGWIWGYFVAVFYNYFNKKSV